jgi:hypothetical protein
LGYEWWGQHEAYWISFYLFCRDVLGVRYADEKSADLDRWRDLAKSCCWWWPYENWCVVSERPTVVGMDDRDRIHGGNGPAVSFADGWSVWAWHGVRVAQHVIEQPQRITVAEIERESNAEVRRVLLERYGPARYLVDSGAAVIDRVALDDTRVPFGVRGAKLLRKEVPGDEPLVFVELRNSTPEPDGSTKVYHLRVPPDMRSCIAAVAWTWDKAAGDYAPQAET